MAKRFIGGGDIDVNLDAGVIASGTLNADRVPGTIDGVVLTHVAPAGSVTAFAGASAPAGWIFCNGSAVSRSTYAALFAAIGTAYGAGDGSTTFNLPDMRGVFARGAGTNGTANYGGRTGHTPAGGALATKGKQNTARNGLGLSWVSANISVSTNTHSHSGVNLGLATQTSSIVVNGNFPGMFSNGSTSTYTHNHSFNKNSLNSSQSWAGDTETAPASLSLNYIIKV